MANNREISQFGNYLTIDENVNKNVGIATTVRISGGGGLYVGGIEVIDPTGTWKGPGSGLIGAQGAQGAAGSQGSIGAQGSTGAQGSQGVQGTFGPSTIPQNAQTSAYILAISDVGKHISITTGGVTVPASVFSAGDAISIYNNSGSNQTITQGSSVTMYSAGAGVSGNRVLAQRGVCTVLCVGSNTFVIFGIGLS